MNKKTFRLLTIAVGIVGVLGFVFRPGPPVVNDHPSGSNIIAFGDSITAGFGVAPGECYVDFLSRDLGVPIANAGVSGDTTTSALGRLQRDVLDCDPKVVILFLGGNDILNRSEENATGSNLASMIQSIQNAGAAVVLVGVDGPLGLAGLSGAVKKLSDRYGTACIPNAVKGILGHPDLMADQIHPNAEGHRIIAERLARVMRKRLPVVFP
jgi:acyl-CoA thioesterase-1